MITLTQATVFADESVKSPDKPSLESTVVVSSAAAQPVQKLSDIKNIFVAPLGTGDDSELIRQKIINQLIQSEILRVVDSPEEADATLTGVARIYSGMDFSIANGTGGGSTYQTACLVARLVGKTKQALWIWDTTQSRRRKAIPIVATALICPYALLFCHRYSVSSELVKDLTKAIQRDKKANQLSCAH
jgi:hypothetical protein